MRPIRSPFQVKKDPGTREALMGVLEIQKLIAELQNLRDDTATASDLKLKEIDQRIYQAENLAKKAVEAMKNEVLRTNSAVLNHVLTITVGPQGPEGKQGKEGPQGIQGVQGPKGERGRDGNDGKNGENGKDADPQAVADYIKENKILNPEHINGLEDLLRDIHNTARTLGGYNMRGGGDTVVAGNGISITRDANGKSTITNTGSASNKVRDEEPSGSGTSFTLAHTPIANTLQLYRGGIRIQQGVGKDYTLSGTTITLASALSTGEILLADYDYV